MPKQEEEKKEETKVKLSPAEIWGKVITQLREKNMKMLFIACGEISNVTLEDDMFIITAQENNKIIIDTPQNLQILQEIISFYLPNCKINVKEENSEEFIYNFPIKLVELFGDKLIKGE